MEPSGRESNSPPASHNSAVTVASEIDPDTFHGLTIALAATLGGIVWMTDFWVEPLFDWLAGFFTFPGHPLLQLRRPTQLPLLLWHVRILVALLGATAVLRSRSSPDQRWLWNALIIGYLLRAAVWCIGGNLPMVPADSAHHWCIADAVFRGQGPTLDYVASFFRVYPRWGMVDDWSMPLYPIYLAGAFLVAGPSLSVAKEATFLVNLAAIPALFLLARRTYGPRVAAGSALTLAVFPPHVLYASFLLKESLAVFCTVVAVGAFLWAWRSRRWMLPCVLAGVATGLMILTRRTCLAAGAAMLLYGLLTPARTRWGRLLIVGAAAVVTLIPWGWLTYRDYGIPFYSYTSYFSCTPDWTVHWRERGVPSFADYLSQPLHDLLHQKCIAAFLVASHVWFVFSPPLALAYFSGWQKKWALPLGRLSLLVFMAFVGGTLVNVASLDQVRDFGRYFVVPLTLMIPTAIASLIRLVDEHTVRDLPAQRIRVLLAILTLSCLWSAAGWTRNFNLLWSPWHLQLTRYVAAGRIVRATLPPDAVIMSYQPWELHMYSDRRTVLMPRSLDPRRLREEADTYGVTHIMLDDSLGRALPMIVQEFGISVPPQFASERVGVFPIHVPNPPGDDSQ